MGGEEVGDMLPWKVRFYGEFVKQTYDTLFEPPLVDLILAVADYADGTLDAAPTELSIALKSEVWGQPFSTGWMELPAAFVTRMTVARNYYKALKGFNGAKKAADWANANPDAFRLVTNVQIMQRDKDG